MTRDETLQRLRAAAPALRRQGVVRAWLFGSAARDTAGEASDVDVAIEVADDNKLTLFKIGSIRADLVDAVERDVDVVIRSDIAAHPAFDVAFRRDAVPIL